MVPARSRAGLVMEQGGAEKNEPPMIGLTIVGPVGMELDSTAFVHHKTKMRGWWQIRYLSNRSQRPCTIETTIAQEGCHYCVERRKRVLEAVLTPLCDRCYPLPCPSAPGDGALRRSLVRVMIGSHHPLQPAQRHKKAPITDLLLPKYPLSR